MQNLVSNVHSTLTEYIHNCTLTIHSRQSFDIFEICTFEIPTSEISAFQIFTLEISTYQISAFEICTFEISTLPVKQSVTHCKATGLTQSNTPLGRLQDRLRQSAACSFYQQQTLELLDVFWYVYGHAVSAVHKMTALCCSLLEHHYLTVNHGVISPDHHK